MLGKRYLLLEDILFANYVLLLLNLYLKQNQNKFIDYFH